MLETSRRTSVGSMTMSKTVEYAFSLGPTCSSCSPKAFAVIVDALLILISILLSAYFIESLKNMIGIFGLNGLYPRIRGLIIAGLMVLPLFLLKDLKFVAPFSILANLLTIALSIWQIITILFKGEFTEESPKLIECNLQSLVFVGLSLLAMNSFGVVCSVPLASLYMIFSLNYYFLTVHNRRAASS